MYHPMFKRADSVNEAAQAILQYEQQDMSEEIGQLVAKLHENFFSAKQLINTIKGYETK